MPATLQVVKGRATIVGARVRQSAASRRLPRPRGGTAPAVVDPAIAAEEAAVRAVLPQFARGVQVLVEGWFQARRTLPAGVTLRVEVEDQHWETSVQLFATLSATVTVQGAPPVVAKFERMFDPSPDFDCADLVNLALDCTGGGCVGDVSGWVPLAIVSDVGLALIVAVSAAAGAVHDLCFGMPVAEAAALGGVHHG